MKFAVLALDYDGTIAGEHGVHPAVRDSILAARNHGLATLLVTGRRLQSLRDDGADLALFDAVVAENGAVLLFPASGHHRVLSRRPPEGFLSRLASERVPHELGECVVETEAARAGDVLRAMRDLHFPLALTFNRQRLMVLPPAIGKGTGLRVALRAMRLSEHNTLAIGDAENDHELLETAEVGAAVEWGSEALRSVADDVVRGTGPPDVAAYVGAMLDRHSLPAPPSARRFVMLGEAAPGQTLGLAVRGRNLLIAGDPRSGKSWVAGLLAEQLVLLGYSVCVVDPEGDYRSLTSLPGVIHVPGDPRAGRVGELLRLLRHPDLSVVVDLTALAPAEKPRFVTTFLGALAAQRRETGLPHRVVVDEAHYFLHDSTSLRCVDLELLGYTLVTYRVSWLHPAIRDSAQAIVVTRETSAEEVEMLAALAGAECSKDWVVTLGSLALDEAVLLPGSEEAGNCPRRFRIAPRLTEHVRHRHKYLEVPISEEHAFVFTLYGRPTGPRARTLTEFKARAAEAPPEVMAGHLERGDVSRWVRGVFRDETLAGRIAAIERRWRETRDDAAAADILECLQERYPLNGARPRPVMSLPGAPPGAGGGTA